MHVSYFHLLRSKGTFLSIHADEPPNLLKYEDQGTHDEEVITGFLLWITQVIQWVGF